MKEKIFLLFIIFAFISCEFHEKVRVNIIGYTKLKSFEIKLNEKSEIYLDNKKIDSSKIIFFPYQKEANINKIKRKFKRIKIKSNGIIYFNSKYGDQGYEGDFIIIPKDEIISIINIINIDHYLASVLGSEMGESFSDETLKAQAIAIRTYYYSRRKEYKDEDYDINNADGRDIVYRGADFAAKKMYEIMKETDNLFLVNNKGQLGLPLFHSTSCGIILKDEALNSLLNDYLDEPVLVNDIDKFGVPLSIDSPYFNFSESISENDLVRIIYPLSDIKSIKDIEIKYFNNTDCVDFIGFRDNNDQIFWLKAYKFLSLVQRAHFNNLRSIRFDFEKNGIYYIFKGTGFGHLCGMSQYSAEKLAKEGLKSTEILKKYYPKFTIKKLNRFILLYKRVIL